MLKKYIYRLMFCAQGFRSNFLTFTINYDSKLYTQIKIDIFGDFLIF